MKIIATNFIGLLFVLLLALAMSVAIPQSAFADTHEDDTSTATDQTSDDSDEAEADSDSDLTDLLATLQALLAQVEELQAKLSDIRGEVRDLIGEGIEEGMTSDEIREIQELLASDSEIYPEGYTTGYFGSLTRSALKRFQHKFELEVTGEVDEETRAALNTILENKFGGDVPQGLLHAPGIQKKFERRLELGCDNSGHGKALFCMKVKTKYKFEDEDEDEDDDSDEDEDEDEDEDSDEDESDEDDSEDSDDDSDEDEDEDDDSDDDTASSTDQDAE